MSSIEKLDLVFACDDCGKLYETETDAQDCCPNTATQKDGEYFKCGNCGEIFDEEEDAKRCCL